MTRDSLVGTRRGQSPWILLRLIIPCRQSKPPPCLQATFMVVTRPPKWNKFNLLLLKRSSSQLPEHVFNCLDFHWRSWESKYSNISTLLARIIGCCSHVADNNATNGYSRKKCFVRNLGFTTLNTQRLLTSLAKKDLLFVSL